MGVLLEREELLVRLEAHRSEGGRLVFVAGEAGVGKTALVRELTARAGESLFGACENLAAATPFGPFVDIGVAESGDPREVAAATLRELERVPLLVLEDVHWADQATLDALRVLGRRIDQTAALVVATFRDDEVEGSHPLRVVLGELASAPGVFRLAVPRLSVDAVRDLAEPVGADADAIHRLTLGNAFYVTEILASGTTELPETVRDAVLARASRLDPTARALLDVVSVVPSRVELSLLETVGGAELSGLESCLATGMLRADGDSVSFRHELARLAVESDLAPHRRRALHAAMMRALEGSEQFSRLAHHAEGAGATEHVLEYALEAARRAAASSAHREAATQYARALRHVDGLPEEDRAELLAAHAHESSISGGSARAIESWLEAIELYRGLGDAAREGEMWARLSGPYVATGENAEAESASTRAIELLEPLGPSPALAYAYNRQATLRMLNRDNSDGVAWGRRALDVAEQIGDDEETAQALNYIGTSQVMAGEIDAGVEHLVRSLELARSHGDEIRITSALGMLGSGLGEMYELGAAQSYLEEQIRFGEEHDLFTLYSVAWLACVHVYRGRWEDATALALSVVHSESVISKITGWIALGRVRARRGDPGALEALDEALELSLPGGHLQRLGHVYAARAEAAWLAGDPARTVAEARAAYPLALEKRHLWFAGELAYWQWKADALDGAPEWIAKPYRLQLDGDVAAAAAAWRERGCPYEAARALADADDEAAQLEALAELERLGAAPAVAQLRRRLGRRGPRPSTRENPAGLTGRELDVLRLVAEGKRNADVAAELVLSTRTVDHHVAAILRKLQARTRGEAVAAATELGVLQDR